jgi:Copper transport outer membrane protein, MctB
MVDFRYHLISLIAVILALALGILAGSGFLGGPILEQLQDDVATFRAKTSDLQATITEQDARLDQAQDFAERALPYIVRGQLAGDEVVLFQFEGTDARVVDGVRQALSDAGAQIVTQITLSQKFQLDSAPARDELSLITGSLSGDIATLQEGAATILGQRAAAAAADEGQADAPNTTAVQRFEAFLTELEASEFVGVELPPVGPSVPRDAEFLVVGGSDSRSPFEVGAFVSALAESLSEDGSPTIVVEGSTSTWEMVAAVRSDIEARTRTATVDNAETIVGHIAVVLGLDQAARGSIGHFGIKAGRTAIIPAPNPSV